MSTTNDEQTILERLIDWGEQRDSVRAMLMTSSRATPLGSVDVFSDFDIILALTDIMPYVNDRNWLEDFGPVLTLFRDPVMQDGDLRHSGNVTQYETGLKIDFTLWPVERLKRIVAQPELPDEFDAGYRVLLDKDNLTAGLKPPTYKAYIPTPPTEAEYQEIIELFFLDAIYAAKFLWRDDLVAAKHMMDYFIKQDYIIPMLVWHYEIEHQWSVKPGPFGRRLKRWLRPDLWVELESTYAGADLQENWQALFRAVALFRRVAVEVGDHLGYAYPHDLEKRVNAYLLKVRNLDRQAESLP